MGYSRNQKGSLREQLKQLRADIPPALRRQHDAQIRENLLALPQLTRARSIFCFLSHDTEVDTHTLVTMLENQNKVILIPKVTTAKRMVAVRLQSRDELEPDQWGILTPLSSTPYEQPIDLCITPGLGFSSKGERLGFGRGYYDVWLSEHPVNHKIGLAYECQVLEHIPSDDTDIAMDILVTEKRILYTSGIR